VLVFVREHNSPRATLVDGDGDGAADTPTAARRGSLVGNLRLVLSERQVVLMLALLFCLWLSTTFVRPLLPISIDDFATHDSAGDHVDLHLGGTTLELGEKRASSYVFAVIGLTSTIAALTVGRAARAVGYKRCVAGSALLTGLLFLPVALAPSYGFFLVFFAATGLFQGAMVPGMNALLAASTPEGKQGSAFGLAASMQSLALFVGPLSGGAIVAIAGIRWDYAVVSIILVAGSIAAFAFIREPRSARAS
jgi:MFS family permease